MNVKEYHADKVIKLNVGDLIKSLVTNKYYYIINVSSESSYAVVDLRYNSTSGTYSTIEEAVRVATSSNPWVKIDKDAVELVIDSRK